MQNRKYISLLSVGLIAASLAVAIPAFADTNRNGQNKNEQNFNMMKPNVVGKVSVINGNTITVISQRKSDKNGTGVATTFTVDATNAKILRGETAIKVSDIVVGDNVVVQGTITGTNVAATVIRDGKIGNGNENENNQALLQIQGNGQPVVAGKVTAISGSTITITNSNVTYTINASSAKFLVGGATSATILNVTVGDNIIAQGTVNGTSMVASTVIDQKAKTSNGLESNSGNNPKPRGFMGGMMNGIGNFFRRMFGF